jgi:lysophospholipase L1-like esterase
MFCFLRAIILVGVVLFGFSPSFAEDACLQSAVNVAITPKPPSVEAGIKAVNDLKAVSPPKADIAVVGDSISAGWAWFSKDLFPGKSVFNFGNSGDRTENVLWRLDQAAPRTAQPQVTVVLIGTNNLSSASLPPCAIATGTEKILDEVRQLWPETIIFVIGITPRGPDFHFRDADRLAINATVVQYAKSVKNVVPVTIEPETLTCGQYSATAPVAGESLVCENYKPDNLHFVKGGYVAIRKALASKSTEVFGRDLFN